MYLKTNASWYFPTLKFRHLMRYNASQTSRDTIREPRCIELSPELTIPLTYLNPSSTTPVYEWSVKLIREMTALTKYGSCSTTGRSHCPCLSGDAVSNSLFRFANTLGLFNTWNVVQGQHIGCRISSCINDVLAFLRQAMRPFSSAGKSLFGSS